jgi:hypothetical protein
MVMSTPSSPALTSRISRAFRAGSSGRVRVARARDGRRRSFVRRADGSGGRGSGDGKAPAVDAREGVDWDGAWNAFQRDFVGDDAKMPNDYVETRFQSNRYASSRHFPSRSTRRIAMEKTDAFAFVPRARADAPPTPTRNNKFTTTKIP